MIFFGCLSERFVGAVLGCLPQRFVGSSWFLPPRCFPLPAVKPPKKKEQAEARSFLARGDEAPLSGIWESPDRGFVLISDWLATMNRSIPVLGAKECPNSIIYLNFNDMDHTSVE